jgi:hypothetical protein
MVGERAAADAADAADDDGTESGGVGRTRV